jgi:hypothetical protein
MKEKLEALQEEMDMNFELLVLERKTQLALWLTRQITKRFMQRVSGPEDDFVTALLRPGETRHREIAVAVADYVNVVFERLLAVDEP